MVIAVIYTVITFGPHWAGIVPHEDGAVFFWME